MRKNGLQILEIDTIDWPHNPLEIFMVLWQAGAANLARKISKEDYSKLEPTFLILLKKGKNLHYLITWMQKLKGQKMHTY